MSSGITTYCRIRGGSQYVSKQVALAFLAGYFLFIRDFVIMIWHKEAGNSEIYFFVTSTLEVLTVSLDISVYWLFAFKYWTASLVIS